MSHTHLINHLIETECVEYEIDDILMEGPQVQATAQQTQKIRVGVIMGGRSNEREISLESGRNIVYKLSPHTYQTVPLFLDSTLDLYPMDQRLLACDTTREIKQELQLLRVQKIEWHALPQLIDFAFIALHGGEGEDGSIQGALEMLGLPYNGSGAWTSALALDKYRTQVVLKHHGFDVPASVLVEKKEWATAAETIIAHTKQHALIEEGIPGMEITIGVVGNDHVHAFVPSYTVSIKDVVSIEEKFLNQTPAPLPEAAIDFIRTTAAHAYKTLGARGYACIDCFYQDEATSPTGQQRVAILKINTLPALAPTTCLFHQAAEEGIRPMELIDLIIELGFQEHASAHPRSSAFERLVRRQVAG